LPSQSIGNIFIALLRNAKYLGHSYLVIMMRRKTHPMILEGNRMLSYNGVCKTFLAFMVGDLFVPPMKLT
jgi:hypothetical protein